MTHPQAEHILSGTCCLRDMLTYTGASDAEVKEALKIVRDNGATVLDAYTRLCTAKAERFLKQLNQLP